MFYWGMDKQYPQLMTHNLFVSGDYEYSMSQGFRDKSLPDEPNFYVHAPMRVDPASAPPGQETLTTTIGHSIAGSSCVVIRSTAQKPERTIIIIARLAATLCRVNTSISVDDVDMTSPFLSGSNRSVRPVIFVMPSFHTEFVPISYLIVFVNFSLTEFHSG